MTSQTTEDLGSETSPLLQWWIQSLNINQNREMYNTRSEPSWGCGVHAHKNSISEGSRKDVRFPANMMWQEMRGLQRWLSIKPNWMLFQRTQVWFPAPEWWLTAVLNSHSRESVTVFWHTLSLYTYVIISKALIHIKWNKMINKIIKKRKYTKFQSSAICELSVWTRQSGLEQMYPVMAYSEWGLQSNSFMYYF